MKFRKIKPIIAVLVAASMLTLCGCKDKSDKKTDTNNVKEETTDADEKKEDTSKKPEESKPDENALSDIEVYESFINGDIECSIKYDDSSYNASEKYDIEGMINAPIAYLVEEGLPSNLVDTSYAFIDCGADWKPELLVKVCYGYEGDLFGEMTRYLFFDNTSEGLNFIASAQGYYRSYTTVNQYGVIENSVTMGAASYEQSLRYVNADGENVFLYVTEGVMGLEEPMIPGEYVPDSIADDSRWPERITATGDHYYVTECVNFNEYKDGDSFDDYKKGYMYTFYDCEGNGIMPKKKFMELYDELGITYLGSSKMTSAINEHLEEMGCTSKIKNGGEPEWTTVERFCSEAFLSYNESSNDTEQVYRDDPVVYEIDNPSWLYYNVNTLPLSRGSYHTLKQISCENNDIIDEDEWFADLGMNMPDYSSFEDDDYIYEIGGEGYKRYLIYIKNKSTGETESILDFSNYIYPDNYKEGDFNYIDESIGYLQVVNGIMYVSVYHSTYAESASHNAYIVALDTLDSFNVLWKTEPLTCNSKNFAIIGKTIICGYGFTAEPDYLYLLNIDDGSRMDTIKVATAVDYIISDEDESQLFVRTYNKNYVFEIQ